MKRVLYIDMDNVLVDFRSGMAACDEATLREYGEHPDDIPGIFAKMQPMPGAVEAFAELSSLFDTYILSTAPWNNPTAWSDKLEWVQRHLGEAANRRLILSHHKNLNRGDVLVDDRTNHGAGDFEGHHVHFGQPGLEGWKEVLVHLRERASCA